jgi:hypothetical protein
MGFADVGFESAGSYLYTYYTPGVSICFLVLACASANS